MKDKQFEKKLKEDLQQYISKVNVQDIWSSIESEVDTINERGGKKRKTIVWLLALAIIGLLGGVGLWKTSSSDGILLGKKTDASGMKKNVENISPVIVEVLSTELGNENKTNVGKNKLKIQGRKRSDDASNANKKWSNRSSQKSIASHLKSTPPFSSTIHLQKNKAKKLKNSTPKSNSISTKNTPFDFFIKKQKKTIAFKESPSVGSVETKIQQNNASSLLMDGNIKLLPPSLFFVKNKMRSLPLFTFEKVEEDTPKKRRKRRRQRKPMLQFGVGIHSGVSWTNRSLENKNGELTSYLIMRNETEKSLETIHLGLSVDLVHRSGIEISTGFQFSRIAETFEFRGTLIKNDTIDNGLYGFLINPNGDTIPVFGQIINSQEISTSKKFYNKYRLLEIPLLVGYHWQNKKWSLGFQTGILANLQLKTSGRVFDKNNLVLNLKDNQTVIFKSKVGMSYYFGGTIRYAITKHLQITTSPFFRVFPKSFTVVDYGLEQKYKMAGMNMGLRIGF